MNWVSTRVVYSILFYILTMLLIIVARPSVIFERDGSLKPFGVGVEKTMFSLGVFAVVGAVMSFYVFCIIDLVFG